MEDVWKGINLYHHDDFFGNGFRNKKRRKGFRVEKRKYLRDLRKLGFDTTELWSLDSTIIKWLAKKEGGFFKMCGNPDDWDMFELGGTKWDSSDTFSFDKCNKAYKARMEDFKEHLRIYLNKKSSEFATFIIPRLRNFAKNTDGYPALCKEIKNLEDWKNIINEMADKFEQGTYSEKFIQYFFNLWT